MTTKSKAQSVVLDLAIRSLQAVASVAGLEPEVAAAALELELELRERRGAVESASGEIS